MELTDWNVIDQWKGDAKINMIILRTKYINCITLICHQNCHQIKSS